MTALPTGTVTFMFTDVEGSTQLAETLGNEEFLRLLEHQRETIGRCADSNGGRVVKFEGDGCFLVFPSAEGALNTALRAQQELLGHQLKVRMGIHTGEAAEKDGDYEGLAVSRASRVADAAHGGQVLITDVTRNLLPGDTGAVDMGTHRLRNMTSPERLWLAAGDPAKGLRSTESARHQLPRQRTTFIGRDRETQALAELVRSERLVTLIGVGGAGKTRLAIAAASEVLSEFQHGGCLVELGSVSRDDGVSKAVLAALGDTPMPGASPEQIDATVTRSIGSDRVLIVLDNCEHLLDAAAEVVEAILDECPNAVILATSREALDIEGEHTFNVRPLSETDAAELFMQRMHALRPDESADRDAIDQICERLDGIPLAIELAAAQTATMAVPEILQRLQDRFQLLTGSRRKIQRQQTLEAALDWSHQLLDPKEQKLLRWLAVWESTFTSVDAGALGEQLGMTAFEGENVLRALVRKSLVTFADAASNRYRLLETVRMYAAQKLVSEDEAAAAREAHAVTVLRRSESEDRDAFTAAAGAELVKEVGDARAALGWFWDHDRTVECARLAIRSTNLALTNGATDEICDLLDRLIELDLPGGLHDELLGWSSWAHTTAMNFPKCVDLALRMSDEADPGALVLGAGLGAILTSTPTFPRPDVFPYIEILQHEHDRLYERFRDAWARTDLPWAKAIGGYLESMLRCSYSDWDGAVAAVDNCRTFTVTDMFANSPLVCALHLSGRHQEAYEALDRAGTIEAMATDWEYFYVVPRIVALVGLGRTQEARDVIRESFVRELRKALPLVIETEIGAAGLVMLAEGHIDHAAQMIGFSMRYGSCRDYGITALICTRASEMVTKHGDRAIEGFKAGLAMEPEDFATVLLN